MDHEQHVGIGAYTIRVVSVTCSAQTPVETRYRLDDNAKMFWSPKRNLHSRALEYLDSILFTTRYFHAKKAPNTERKSKIIERRL